MLDMFQRIAFTPIQFAGRALKELDDLTGGQIDQQLARTIHQTLLSENSTGPKQSTVQSNTSQQLVAEVEDALQKGLQLKRWLESKQGNYQVHFPVVRRFNRSESSFGFYDRAVVDGNDVPVMGVFEEFSFDRVRSDNLLRASDNLREFVLKYLLRISDYRLPETVADFGKKPPAFLKPISWCLEEDPEREGFGYEQLLLKRLGKVQAIDSSDRFGILDLRQVNDELDWLLLNVEIFDFNFSWQPFGSNGAELVLPARQSSYLAVSTEFITDEPANHDPHSVAEFGIGYAFVRNPEDSLFAYGPGRFDAAIKLINFRLLQSGEIKVQMTFVANRPNQVSSIPLNPLGWLSPLTSALPVELARQLEGLMPKPFGSANSFDPVSLYADILNAATCGFAKRKLCVSREQLEKLFLARHYQQHYQMIVGALSTWRSISDWTNESGLPGWVRTGVSS